MTSGVGMVREATQEMPNLGVSYIGKKGKALPSQKVVRRPEHKETTKMTFRLLEHRIRGKGSTRSTEQIPDQGEESG